VTAPLVIDDASAGAVAVACDSDSGAVASVAAPAGGPTRPRIAGLIEAFKADHLVQNSFYIMLSTATMGLLGFLFWVLNARIFNPSQIGIATTLISATSLISYLSLLGFNSTFIRYLPNSTDRDAEINTGLWLVFIAAVVASGAYVLAIPAFAPKLSFVRYSNLYAVGFVVLTAFSAVNLLTDSVFVAYRAAKYNFFVDGLIQGGAKLALPIAFLGMGAYGIFAASGVAAVAAVVCSLIFMVRAFAFRPELRIRRAIIRRTLSYSAVNYASNVLNIFPLLVLPIIVIDGRGAAQAGYYFVAFQIANLANAVAYAISQSLFAEGSYAGSDLGHLARRSGKLLALIVVPGAAVLALASKWVLLIFGTSYSQRATATLVCFALAVPAVALNNWVASLLRLTKQLSVIVWSNVLYVAVMCSLAVVWVQRGLAWVALAWLLANLVCGAAGGLALLGRDRRLVAGTAPAGAQNG
jgi:O-antigen/teichoic acid export membrane protein